MKKLTIIGLSDKVVMDMMPHLLGAKVDFMVEDLSQEGAHLEVEEGPKPSDAEAQPAKQLAPPVPPEPPKEPPGLPLPELILQWLKTSPGKELERDILRDHAEKMGYARGSVNPAVSTLVKRLEVITDGTMVRLGRPRPKVRLPYGRPLNEIVLEVLGDREVARDELVNELVDKHGIHKPTADVCVGKMMKENLLAYTGFSNNVVRYEPDQGTAPVNSLGEKIGEDTPVEQQTLFDLGNEYNGSVQ